VARDVTSQLEAALRHALAVISRSDWLRPWQVVAEHLKPVSFAGAVIAIYNPALTKRRRQLADRTRNFCGSAS